MSRSTKLIKALEADDAGNVLLKVTPPQGDKSKKAATTEFVQQELGGGSMGTAEQYFIGAGF